MVDLGWDDAADVVIVGGGGAGMRAALAAAKEGGDVILLEKMGHPGGKTAMSIGIITASETAYQSKAGVKDNHAKHFADLAAMAKAAGQPLDVPATKFMIRECSKEVDALEKLGVKFSGPHPEGPHGTPRMHVIQPDCRSMADKLVKACKKAKVRIMCNMPGAELVLDTEGQVVGVRADGPDGPKHIQAKAVVLAAGDYSANTELVKKVAPKLKLAEPLAAFATGDGHRMAMRIGAATRNMHRVNTPHMRFPDWPHVEPSPGLVGAGAVLVDGKGKKIKTELDESVLLPGFEDRWEDIFIVIDRETATKLAKPADDVGPGRDGWVRTGKPFIGTAPKVGYAYLEDCRNWQWHHETRTLAAAARHIGCTTSALEKSMGKSSEGPYHILGPVRRVLANSGGGVSTDYQLNVINSDGKPIKGLFGAGVNARLITFMGGHGYAFAWAMASGRIAGGNAGKYAKTRARKK
jgi:succinate dehydrogenase/fumarate reductase flavoprotein subunit